jgi:hypothetical protein
LFGVLRLHRGRFADPDLYFWVPHGYGEYRDNSAEEPFMEGDMVNGVMSGIGKFRFLKAKIAQVKHRARILCCAGRPLFGAVVRKAIFLLSVEHF